MKNPNKQEAGRKGGQAVTPRKSEAARQNGFRGGRPSANEAYQKRSREVTALMDEVRAHLKAHAARQAANSTNWGFVGDLEAYAEKLNVILGREPKAYTVPDRKGGFVRVTIPE
jgi:hypothetical protein